MFQTYDPPEGRQSGAERTARLRQLMAKAGLDAVLVPRADEHQGEYVAPSAERLKWLTGFSGSASISKPVPSSASIPGCTTPQRSKNGARCWTPRASN